MIVLDSSALLAVLFIERGADRVIKVLPQSSISSANLAEVLGKAEQNGVDSEAAYAAIVELGVTVIDATSLHARLAAKIGRAPRSLNLSPGDRLCIALAIVLGADILTSDRAMAKFSAGVSIQLFR